MKILVLYSRLAGYWVTSMRKFVASFGGEFIVFRDVNSPNSPFDFNNEPGIRLYDNRKFDKNELLQFCIKEAPDLVYVAGWNYEKYLHIAGHFRKKHIPVVCGIDNPWTNSVKQRIGRPVLKNILHRYFTHAWVAGDSQYEFARRLGFRDHQILENLYTADLDLFSQEHQKNKARKSKKFPHRFIFAGRYVPVKGIEDLWKAFIQLQDEIENDWELWCLGTGDLYDTRPEHPRIRHFGFVQPADFPGYLKETGVFVLPSHTDHWGVVVHEFAAAGYPLICSDNVGAATRFLNEGENGFIHQAGDVRSLKNAMKKIIACSDEELIQMGDSSAEKAKMISPEVWSQSLMGVLKESEVEVSD